MGKNEVVLGNESFLQSDFWASFKARYGWTAVRVVISSGDGAVRGESISVLLRRIKPFGVFAYIPMAPSADVSQDMKDNATTEALANERGKLLLEIAEQLKIAVPKAVFMIRFDPPWEFRQDNTGGKSPPAELPLAPRLRGIKKSSTDIQPPNTVCLDLELPEADLLAQCKAKWRYNIRLAEKKGLNIRLYRKTDLQTGIAIFYTLYRETAERDGIAIHSQQYYRDLCSVAQEQHVDLRIYLAEYQDEALAAIVTLFMPQGMATYLYGASSNRHRNLMPAYLLQWKAICDAKNAGCYRYDFYGIPPTDDESHPMYGLYRFKTGFGGSIVRRVGSIDLPLKRTVYWAYCNAEKLRAFWFKKIKKILR